MRVCLLKSAQQREFGAYGLEAGLSAQSDGEEGSRVDAGLLTKFAFVGGMYDAGILA